MENDIDTLEPLRLFENTDLKQNHKDNIEKKFEEFVSLSKIDVEANKKTCKKYYTASTQSQIIGKEVGKWGGLQSLFIILGVISIFVGFIILGASITDDETIWKILTIGAFVISIGLSIAFFIISSKVFNKKRKEALNKQNKVKEEMSQLLKLAWQQMAPLNSAFTWNIPSRLLTESVPLLKLDDYFDLSSLIYLKDNFNYKDINDKNSSSLLIQSGSILGNPFIIEKDLITWIGKETYTGSITIHWTTTYTDKDGVHTSHHSEVLTASVVKDKPFYDNVTKLVYANEAAPDLSFSRSPTGSNKMNEKERERYVKSFYKKLDKKAEKAVGKTNFTALANTEFEAFFNALNRNNEVQYRLLFTPLAQRNMLELLKSKPYGDDFIFKKSGMINTIISAHAQTANYDTNPRRFYNFDIEKCKASFIEQNQKYFQDLYFDLAPLLSIPLYQLHQDYDRTMKEKPIRNVTRHETEVITNRYKEGTFDPDESALKTILKHQFVRKEDNFDVVEVKAYNYKAIPHVELISKFGGDGEFHQVPVHWIEYIPIEKVTPLVVGKLETLNDNSNINVNENINRNSFCKNNCKQDNILLERGLISFLLKK